VISAEGTRPDERKLEAIKNFKALKCVKDVQSFLEMANHYRKFVRDFSEIAYPLTRLTRKGIEFEWTEEEQKALDELKAHLSSSEVMRSPDFTQPFKLCTDTSLVAIGSVLCQDFPDGERPIAYYSKTLQPTWTRYSAVEREMLAVLLSVRKIRFYILGRDITVITDCSTITYLKSIKDTSNPRLVRWAIELAEYRLKLVYRVCIISSGNRVTVS